MMIVDAQVHPWREGQASGHHRQTPMTVEVLQDEMRGAGVDRVLLVPPLWDPAGNRYALEAARCHPDRFRVMGLLDCESLDPALGRERLAGWNRQPGMVGLRFLLNSPERAAPLRDGRLDWVWPAAEEAGLTVALLIPGGLDAVAAIATRHPGLDIIVDHLAVPRGARGPAAFQHLPELLALGRFPNIAVKAAGVGDYATDPYPFRSLDEPLRRVFDTFGPRRIVWASDLSRLRHPYRECTAHFAEALPWLSAGDRALIMGENICRITGWRVTPAGADSPGRPS